MAKPQQSDLFAILQSGSHFEMTLPMLFLCEQDTGTASHYAAAAKTEKLLRFLDQYGVQGQLMGSEECPTRLTRYTVDLHPGCPDRAFGVYLCVAAPRGTPAEKLLALVHFWRLHS